MGRCIYYKNSDSLRFDKQEHVIPAGLGGKQMLEKGVVSDEANESFSAKELVLLRHSIIGLNRMNNGPGKRGSLNLNKVKNPTMRVIRPNSQYSQMDFVLGFIFMGQSVLVPQLTTYFDYSSISYRYLASDLNVPSVGISQAKLNEKLISFLKNKERKYKLVHMPFTTDKKFILIGAYRKKWYVATSFKVKLNFEVVADDILPLLYELKEKLKSNEGIHEPEFVENVVFRFENELDMNFLSFNFLYLKTAFNALALFKGAKYVLNDDFDEIREGILTVSDLSKLTRLKEELENPEIESYIEKFPNKAHYVIIFSKDNKLNAYVSFYGETPTVVELENNYGGEKFIDGLICNWEKTEEVRLENWI